MERKNNIFSIDQDLLSLYLNNNTTGAAGVQPGSQAGFNFGGGFGSGGGSSYHEEELESAFSTRYNNPFNLPPPPIGGGIP